MAESVTRARVLHKGAQARVGVPHYAAIPASDSAFYHNITVSGGPAPVRAYIAELLPPCCFKGTTPSTRPPAWVWPISSASSLERKSAVLE